MAAYESQWKSSFSLRPSFTVDGLLRLLVAGYFMAAALGMIRDPILQTMLTAYAASTGPQLALVSSLTIAALLMGFGHFQRPAALYLAIFTLASTAWHFGQNWSPEALRGLWLQLLLTGALVMIAMEATTGHARPAARPRRARKNAPVAPRRISVKRSPEGGADGVVVTRDDRPAAHGAEGAVETPDSAASARICSSADDAPADRRSRIKALLAFPLTVIGLGTKAKDQPMAHDVSYAEFEEAPHIEHVPAAVANTPPAPALAEPRSPRTAAASRPDLDYDPFDDIENIFADLGDFEDKDEREREPA